MKLVTLYKQSADIEAFEAAYSKHLDLVAKIPDLQDTRFKKTLAGRDGFYLMAEMIFPDSNTFVKVLRYGSE